MIGMCECVCVCVLGIRWNGLRQSKTVWSKENILNNKMKISRIIYQGRLFLIFSGPGVISTNEAFFKDKIHVQNFIELEVGEALYTVFNIL